MPISSHTKAGKPATLKPPITYYGGKQRLCAELLQLIPEHRLYVEAYMGGGALFFRKTPSQAEVINDLNGEVSNFYSVVQSNFTVLQRRIKGTLHSRSLHQEALSIYNNPKRNRAIDRAWAFWVVTNQGFAARIGSWALGMDNKMGKALEGKRKNFTEAIANRLKHVQIECKDALEVIERYDSESTFFYLDPPYFNSDCGHYKGFLESDFINLLKRLGKIKGKFLLSSYPSEVLDKYIEKHGWNKREKQQAFCVTHVSKKEKTEVMIFNYPPPIQQEDKTDLLAGVQIVGEKSKLVVTKNVAQFARNSREDSLQHKDRLLCFGGNKNRYDQMPAPLSEQNKFSSSTTATLEKIYRSLSNGIRNAKAHVPRKWMAERKLSVEATGACFNSGQIHHRKSDAFKEELASVGFMKKSNVGTNNGQIPYTVFGIFSVMFPLRNENGEVVNFFSVRIKNGIAEYMNEEGIYPNYPHGMTKKLYIVSNVLEAATLLESKVLDNREAVMALCDAELLPQHQQAIKRLKCLEEIVMVEGSPKKEETNSQTTNNSDEKFGKEVA